MGVSLIRRAKNTFKLIAEDKDELNRELFEYLCDSRRHMRLKTGTTRLQEIGAFPLAVVRETDERPLIVIRDMKVAPDDSLYLFEATFVFEYDGKTYSTSDLQMAALLVYTQLSEFSDLKVCIHKDKYNLLDVFTYPATSPIREPNTITDVQINIPMRLKCSLCAQLSDNIFAETATGQSDPNIYSNMHKLYKITDHQRCMMGNEQYSPHPCIIPGFLHATVIQDAVVFEKADSSSVVQLTVHEDTLGRHTYNNTSNPTALINYITSGLYTVIDNLRRLTYPNGVRFFANGDIDFCKRATSALNYNFKIDFASSIDAIATSILEQLSFLAYSNLKVLANLITDCDQIIEGARMRMRTIAQVGSIDTGRILHSDVVADKSIRAVVVNLEVSYPFPSPCISTSTRDNKWSRLEPNFYGEYYFCFAGKIYSTTSYFLASHYAGFINFSEHSESRLIDALAYERKYEDREQYKNIEEFYSTEKTEAKCSNLLITLRKPDTESKNTMDVEPGWKFILHPENLIGARNCTLDSTQMRKDNSIMSLPDGELYILDKDETMHIKYHLSVGTSWWSPVSPASSSANNFVILVEPNQQGLLYTFAEFFSGDLGYWLNHFFPDENDQSSSAEKGGSASVERDGSSSAVFAEKDGSSNAGVPNTEKDAEEGPTNIEKRYMEERKQLLQLLAKPMASLSGHTGESYRNLFRKGKYFEKQPSTAAVHGQNKRCFFNAMTHPEIMYCGYAVLADGSIPIPHCWNVDSHSDDSVIDTTPAFNKSHVIYWGMPIDKDVAQSVYEQAEHGNEFMDCWQSAAANALPHVVNEWRAKLEWTEVRSE